VPEGELWHADSAVVVSTEVVSTEEAYKEEASMVVGLVEADSTVAVAADANTEAV
jgi:hypothetical protein